MWLLLPGAVSLMPSLTPSVPLAQPYASPPNTLLTTGGEKQSRAAEESIAWIPALKAPPLMYMAPNSSTLHLRRTSNRRHWESPVKKTLPQGDPQVPIYQVRKKKEQRKTFWMPWTGAMSAPDRQGTTCRSVRTPSLAALEISADHEGEPHACASLYKSGARAKYGVIVTQPHRTRRPPPRHVLEYTSASVPSKTI